MMNEKRILVAFDFSAPSRRALTISRRYAEALGAAVDVVSVNDEPVAKSMLRSQGRALTQLAEEEAAAALEGIEYKVICPHGEPIRALIDAIKLVKPELVVIGTTGKGRVEQALLGSVSHALVTKAGVPVLTVP